MERKTDKFIQRETPESFLSLSITNPPSTPILMSKHNDKEFKEDPCKTEKYSRHTVKSSVSFKQSQK